ncbi:hypothetical protein GLUCOINTEAF2_0202577 [Komagataeibacter intermedius AF2]|uniref:Uncharacterized protein n=1 Tax=Komagataeibacter intermedius AF2 TaxID=1458464 RepID=A0A0N0MEQ9_9PROT|nr:hypothetical protein GLUCOINTEAF2_0202577 [Komagataeibacter intermedius AF2]
MPLARGGFNSEQITTIHAIVDTPVVMCLMDWNIARMLFYSIGARASLVMLAGYRYPYRVFEKTAYETSCKFSEILDNFHFLSISSFNPFLKLTL